MKKLTLRLDDLAVDSFDTSALARDKGTVVAEQCTCGGPYTCAGTCPVTCDDASCAPTCPYTCDDASCADSCDGTCAGWTCITRCVDTCICY
ncbi:MAG TPA: hypothetical protein VF006_23655 [Longimicrobium sp.]